MLQRSRESVRVFLVDDHPIVRRGLTQFLSSQEGIEVCGDTEDANSAIAMINNCSPDVVLVDISLNGVSGIDLIKAIKSRYKNVNILVLSMHDEPEYLERAIRAGAQGYVLKSDDEISVVEGIQNVINGKPYLSRSLKDIMLENILWDSSAKKEESLKCLADRELEIFLLIGKGYNTREIADNLHLSVSTIGTYRERIKTKLNIETSNQLMKYAVEYVMRQDSGQA